jgi:hypothetical protein
MDLTPARPFPMESFMKILASLTIASLAALTAPPASAAPGETAGSGVTRVLAIVAPAERQMVLANDGDLVISLAASPPLAEGERIVIRVDDEVVVLASGMTQFTLTDVPTGSHVVEAIVVDGDAKPVAEAIAVSFDVRFGLKI